MMSRLARGWSLWTRLLLALAIAAVVVLFFPILFAQARSYSGPGCGNKSRGIARSLQNWVARTGAFPSQEELDVEFGFGWQRRNKQRCPHHGQQYTFNSRLLGVKAKDVMKPGRTILLFETRIGAESIGGPALLLRKPHAGSVIFLVTADFKVHRWNPQEPFRYRWRPK